jgi:hypothetical protein
MGRRVTQRTWTIDEVRALGTTTDLPTAGSVLGLSQHHSYVLARRGEMPVTVLRLGNKLRVPVAALLRLLEVESPPET